MHNTPDRSPPVNTAAAASSGDALQLRFLHGIEELPAADWNRLCGTDYPFLRHEFLAALEQGGSVCEQRGWSPRHVVAWRGKRPVAVMPLYEKMHSYGEFVFDWNWAAAFERRGLSYYPKLLTAVPFTPASGPRCGSEAGEEHRQTLCKLHEAVLELARERGCSSWHLLFATPGEVATLAECGMLRRTSVHFVWHNRGYAEFADFLQSLNARRRKSIRRERRRVHEQGARLRTVSGEQASAADWDLFYACYQDTYARRSGHGGYLERNFFTRLARTLGQQIVLILAERRGQGVAAALCLRSSEVLYGRYWGCLEDIDCLHFETCYYQGIEYCIDNGLQHFDPGVQGEHKILRGFSPEKSYSCHWLRPREFQEAVRDYLQREEYQVQRYLEAASTLLPFKQVPVPER